MSNAAIDNKGEREARNDLAICLKRKRTDGVGAETGRYLAACAEGGIKLAEVIHYQPGSRYVTGQAATLWTALSFHFTGNEAWHQVVGATLIIRPWENRPNLALMLCRKQNLFRRHEAVCSRREQYGERCSGDPTLRSEPGTNIEICDVRTAGKLVDQILPRRQGGPSAGAPSDLGQYAFPGRESGVRPEAQKPAKNLGNNCLTSFVSCARGRPLVPLTLGYRCLTGLASPSPS